MAASHSLTWLELGQRPRHIALQQAAEALQLPLQVALRAAEPGQVLVPGVERVQLDQAVDQLLGDLPRPAVASQRRWQLAPQHPAVDVGHQVEGGADQLGVLAAGQNLRDRHAQRPQGGEQARFARHVVGGGWQRPARRAPQHQPRVAALDQEGEVGVAVADRGDLQLAGAEPGGVEVVPQRLDHDQRLHRRRRCLRRGADEVAAPDPASAHGPGTAWAGRAAWARRVRRAIDQRWVSVGPS